MTSVILIGMVLAIVAISVYITRTWTLNENKKAALEENSKAAEASRRKLNEEKLAREYDLREYEEDEIDRAHSGPGVGSIRLLPIGDKDPDSYN